MFETDSGEGMAKERILIADDEKLVRDLFVEALGGRGYEVDTAAEGIEALQKVRSGGVDLLILDLKMPDMDGTEIMKRIRKTGADFPIFCITAYPSPESLEESLKQGCFDYITKPFDMEEVLALIQRALDVRRVAKKQKEASAGEVPPPEGIRPHDDPHEAL
jgi:CheY-like chemotaxis protein